MAKTILYFKSEWIDNIGNSFIDMGATKSILQAGKFLDEEICVLPVSQYPLLVLSGIYPRWIHFVPNKLISFSNTLLRGYSEKLVRHMEGKANIGKTDNEVNKNVKNALDIVSAIKADYVILSGATLTVRFFSICQTILRNLRKQDARIIFYGCGGDNYSDLEREYVGMKLKEIEPYAIITRDSLAFKYYKDLANFSYDGIDCGFFVNQYPIKKIEIDLPSYIVLNFDSIFYGANIVNIEKELEQELSEQYMIVKTSHTIDPKMASLTVSKYPNKSNTLISDSPFDYLILYAHTKGTYTDRVHACVATLSFGNPCRLYAETARAELLRRIGLGDINRKLVSPDVTRIETEQEKQVRFLSDIIKK